MATSNAHTKKKQQQAPIRANAPLQGDYYQVTVHAPCIVPDVQPGQFVHVLLPDMGHRLLRRPFSVCDVDLQTGDLTIVYKTVGEGTRHLATLKPGIVLDLIGPLGVGYSTPGKNRQPIIVAGGYGCAATYLLAKRSPVPPLVLLGGRSAGDVLLVDRFRDLNCDVRIATDDGSEGHRGFVTDLLEQALADAESPFIAACGPNAMLRTVSRIVEEHGLNAEVSLDHIMCCGVGACFACVVKMKADTPDGWEYIRTCINGPVFQADRIYWEDDD
jgi:dihydroorotate dehydrogenase electron transfer subunit